MAENEPSITKSSLRYRSLLASPTPPTFLILPKSSAGEFSFPVSPEPLAYATLSFPWGCPVYNSSLQPKPVHVTIMLCLLVRCGLHIPGGMKPPQGWEFYLIGAKLFEEQIFSDPVALWQTHNAVYKVDYSFPIRATGQFSLTQSFRSGSTQLDSPGSLASHFPGTLSAVDIFRDIFYDEKEHRIELLSEIWAIELSCSKTSHGSQLPVAGLLKCFDLQMPLWS